MVVHAGSAAFHGTVSGCLAYAHNEQRQTEVMLKLYAERNTAEKYQNKSTKEIVDDLNKRILMKEDIYLIGREIVEEGFADGIMGEGDYPDYECLKN